ncbi:DUF2630 family protein [Streptomyces sp. NPDC057543]|uniref:DUF2630 family protein n=1 Tax=Streptomyces sp. NPDC057543 TaxID=3346163 RepID=UPI0036A44568
MDDRERDIEHDIIDNIGELIAEERDLRNRSTGESGLTEDERSRLRTVEVRLDQCWDLLRQRRALREFGEDPSAATVRPADEVEGYQG